MFRSIGIDNFELKLPVTPDEANALERACDWCTKDGVPVLIRNGIHLRFRDGKVLADLNAPKLAFGHNVRLAGPEQVRKAIRILKTNTERAVPRLNWQRAEVSRLHVTFTLEVPDFGACAALTKAPRGYWLFSFDKANGYHNANGKDLPVNWYDKQEHLREDRLQLPNDIARKMESSENALFRYEARMNQHVYSELKKHGGWNEHSFLAEDLFGLGFTSAMYYLQWSFARHVPVPVDRTPGIRAGMSAREYAAHNTRRAAIPERMREQAHDDLKAGWITRELYTAELARIAQRERRTLALSLHAALEKEVEQMMKILVPINGNLNTPELEHAARTRRNYYSV